MILSSLNSSKATRIDQIRAKSLKNRAEVLTSLRNITSLLIKSPSFPEECKIAKLKHLFKMVKGLNYNKSKT